MEQLNPMLISPSVKKYGPWGAMTGRERQMDDYVDSIARIVNIIIRYSNDVVYSLLVDFERSDGTRKDYSFGGVSGFQKQIHLEKGEYITYVRGYIGENCVQSIEFTTNYTVYGPYGVDDAELTPYEIKPVGGHIIGFHGFYTDRITAIGVYVKEGEPLRQQQKAKDARLRDEEDLAQAVGAFEMEMRKNGETVEELEKARRKLHIVNQSRADEEHQLHKDFLDAVKKLSQMQDSLDKKENDYQELDNSYRELKKNYQELGNSYNNVLDEIKALKRMEILGKEYEMFRRWIEDQASSSFGVVGFTEFTPLDIEAAINDSNYIGRGGYGNVYKEVIGARTVAIKIPKEANQQKAKEFNQEVDILRRVRHPNLVTLIGACREKYALVYEFLPNGSLEDRLFKTKDKEVLSWKERINIAASICSALIFLHNSKPNPIAHGDLKPSNILFDSNNVCKLSDFGISRFLMYTSDTTTPKHETNEPRGSESYMDPDYLESHKLTPQSDVYAFGIILLQLVSRKGPQFLRYHTIEALYIPLDDVNLENFKKRTEKQKDTILKRYVDQNLVDWHMDEIIKMICLGLRCSVTVRKNRPDLLNEVWTEIMSMNGFVSSG